MDVVIGVGIPGLEGEHVSVRRCVQLDDRLHRQRPINEIRWFVVHVLHVDDDTLIVGVCNVTSRLTRARPWTTDDSAAASARYSLRNFNTATLRIATLTLTLSLNVAEGISRKL